MGPRPGPRHRHGIREGNAYARSCGLARNCLGRFACTRSTTSPASGAVAEGGRRIRQMLQAGELDGEQTETGRWRMPQSAVHALLDVCCKVHAHNSLMRP